MEGFIYDVSGTETPLPELTGWELCHGFCSPCDSFELRFLYEKSLFDPLTAACRFRGVHEGSTVFYGVVDEFELSADSSGCVCVLRGRGMQALLLDSEAESADYYGADTDFLLRRHVYPLGVTEADTGGLAGQRASFSVKSGESHWSVVQRFCEFCLGRTPRFDPAGRLLLDGGDSGKTWSLTGRTPVTAERYVQDRYGVLSAATVKNRVRGTSVTVDNPAFQALGGQCVRVVNVPRRLGFDAMRHTGAYQIRRSGGDFLRLRLTVPELFPAFPGDRAELTDDPLGVGGSFRVWSTRCFADGKRAGTVVELRKEDNDVVI